MPNWTISSKKTQIIGILLFERFSNHCLANAVEPLRAANMLSGKTLYKWRFLTLDGLPVVSSSGLQVTPHGQLAQDQGDMLFVTPSYGFMDHVTFANGAALRGAAMRFHTLAGLDTGSWLLAEAGLLDQSRATIHWEELTGFAERFPDIDVRRKRFVVDGPRITCGGASATFDLMLHLIARLNGEALRLEVATLFMSPEAGGIDPGAAPPRGTIVARALALMQENLEVPLKIGEIARRIGRPQKHLEARIMAQLGATPQTVYRRFRLVLARKLVSETDLPVSEISLRCGYQNASAMTRAYRVEFGVSPRVFRRHAAHIS